MSDRAAETLRAKEDEMIEIKGVVVEVPCEACSRSGFVKGAFIARVVCKSCDGNGVTRQCMSLTDLKAALAECDRPHYGGRPLPPPTEDSPGPRRSEGG